MNLSIEQINKLQEFLIEAREWSFDIKNYETNLVDFSSSCSTVYYKKEHERIALELHKRLELINEIEVMFGA